MMDWLIPFIKAKESLHDGDLSKIGLQPKMCPAGIWTEGWGSAIIDPKTGKFLRGIENKQRAEELSTIKTEADADRQLIEVLKRKRALVLRDLRVPLKENQIEALISHRYNCGYSQTLYSLINSRAASERIEAFWTTKYITANGVKLRGLVIRRREEWERFST